MGRTRNSKATQVQPRLQRPVESTDGLVVLIPRDECEVGYHRERRDQREGEKGIDLGG